MFFIYCRRSSTDKDSDRGASLREQERICRGVAMTRGVASTDIVVHQDNGISGAVSLDNRPQGKILIDSAQPGDVVCASKLDRMFRDSLDAQTVYRQFKKAKIDLILVDFGIDPITSGGVSKLLYTVMSAFADMERERIAERLQAGKTAKKKLGGHVGGPAPYGYRVVGAGRDAILEENPDETVILRDAALSFRRHASEIGQFNAVRRELEKAGHRSRTGQPFQIVQVQRLVAQGRAMR